MISIGLQETQPHILFYICSVDIWCKTAEPDGSMFIGLLNNTLNSTLYIASNSRVKAELDNTEFKAVVAYFKFRPRICLEKPMNSPWHFTHFFPTSAVCLTKLIPCSKVFVRKLMMPRLVNKLSVFYGTRSFITAFTWTHHWSLPILSQMNPVHTLISYVVMIHFSTGCLKIINTNTMCYIQWTKAVTTMK
jgi:hypothetical protein